ncbi:MAG: homocysteine S-methyltransferase family protein [Pseudomonadales bacterium]|nr:homocysteine S-methyltransferase family protein [Pseudomonadales bacterium]
MAIFRQKLPQLEGKVFITDGGLETVLVFQQQLELPEFAAYDLLRQPKGYKKLVSYYKTYAELAQHYQLGLVLETPTWRASSDWGAKLGDSPDTLKKLNFQSVELLEQIRAEYQNEKTMIVISGNLGPRGDGYKPTELMSAREAQRYHNEQIATFAMSEVDMVSALTLNYVEEAIGITLSALEHNLPVCISFTLETDGNLPTGESLEQAINLVDRETDQGPVYYMINCAHPRHFKHLFQNQEDWHARVKGLRGNASCLSHAELDESEILDDGNPAEFGAELVGLKSLSPHLSVLGGCCGTDHRHIEQICKNLASKFVPLAV